MRQFPDRVRAVIMKGVTPLSVPLTIPMARDAQRALDLTFDDCLADQACRDAFPNVKDEWQKLLAAVEKGPVETELTGDGGKSERVPFSRATLGPTVRTLLQGVEGAAKLPFLIHRAAAGDFAPFASEALNIRRGFPKVVSEGIFLGLSAIEDVAVTDPQEVVRQSKGTFLRDDYYRQLQRAAELLPNKKMPADYRTPVRSDIPTLLISGFVDPATPPGSADEVARLLKKSRHVVVRYGSHSYGSMSPCIDNIMAEFIKRGAVEGLDTACIEAIKRPPFETSDKN
jgi:pimeloyl-ACP methyl ester carboxylesterase